MVFPLDLGEVSERRSLRGPSYSELAGVGQDPHHPAFLINWRERGPAGRGGPRQWENTKAQLTAAPGGVFSRIRRRLLTVCCFPHPPISLPRCPQLTWHRRCFSCKRPQSSSAASTCCCARPRTTSRSLRLMSSLASTASPGEPMRLLSLQVGQGADGGEVGGRNAVI
jgi:hypothetical protein